MSKVKPITPTQAKVLSYAAGLEGATMPHPWPTRSIRTLWRVGYLRYVIPIRDGITPEGRQALADYIANEGTR